MSRDWEGVEREFRAGQLSIREIARRYELSEAAIRKKAKACLWVRNLAEEVRDAVRTKLVREEVRNCNATDREIIEAAAMRGADVVRIHRADVRAGQGIVAKLSQQLIDAVTERDELERDIEIETAYDKTSNRKIALKKAVSLPTHAGVVRDLSVALKNLIPLERQAFHLDEPSKNPYADMTDEDIQRRLTALEQKK